MTEFTNLVAQISYLMSTGDTNSPHFNALTAQIDAYVINKGWTTQEATNAFNRAQAQWLYK